MTALAGIEEAAKNSNKITAARLDELDEFLSTLPKKISELQDSLLDIESDGIALYKFSVMLIRGSQDVDEIRDAWKLLANTFANGVAQMEAWESTMKVLPDSAVSLYQHTLSKLQQLQARSQELYELHA